MSHSKIRPLDFAEHPATDLYSRRAGIFDVLINFDFQDSDGQSRRFPNEEYCEALLQKMCTLSNAHLRGFIDYQVQLMAEPVTWLNTLDELIVMNAERFDDKILVFKAEKAMLIIELTLQDIKKNHYKKNHNFDFERVKYHLQTLGTPEEQITYLYETRADYLRNPSPPSQPGAIPFDQQIMVEVEKVHQLLESLKRVRKSAKTILEEKYIINEDFMRIMKISKRTCQSWRGKVIGYSQIENKIYFLLEDVEALLKSSYTAALKR